MIWKGDQAAPKGIFILKDETGTYIPITSPYVPIKAYLCTMCAGEYIKKARHRCPYTCTLCGNVGLECIGKSAIYCNDCHFSFTSEGCYNRHKKMNKAKKGSRCSIIKACPECQCTYNTNNLRGHAHVCGQSTW